MLTLLATAALAAATPAPTGAEAHRQARIPFAGFSIRTFRPVDDDTVYFQDRRRNWYRAELIGPCLPLRNALAIAIDSHGSSTLDNTSSILVGGESCRIHSLVHSDPPPRRRRGRR